MTTSSKAPISVDELLVGYFNGVLVMNNEQWAAGNKNPSGIVTRIYVNELKRELLDLLIGAAPEKRDCTETRWKSIRCQGYNAAIDQYIAKTKELFE